MAGSADQLHPGGELHGGGEGGAAGADQGEDEAAPGPDPPTDSFQGTRTIGALIFKDWNNVMPRESFK